MLRVRPTASRPPAILSILTQSAAAHDHHSHAHYMSYDREFDYHGRHVTLSLERSERLGLDGKAESVTGAVWIAQVEGTELLHMMAGSLTDDPDEVMQRVLDWIDGLTSTHEW
jgi:hypothetical protein